MNTLLVQFLFYLFLAIILYNIVIQPPITIETFAPSPNILLIGNIFSDRDHTKYYSIKEQLLKDSKLHTGELISIDDQCSTLDDFKKSISTLARRHPNLNSANTYVFISIGFYDLVKNVNNCEEATIVEPHGSPKAGLTKKLPCITEGEIFKSWKQQLDLFSKSFPDIPASNITIMSAYYLPKDKELTECRLKITPTHHLIEDIDAWNADLAQYCVSKDYGFIAMDKEFKVSDVISGSLDLTNSAKKHLVTILERKIH